MVNIRQSVIINSVHLRARSVSPSGNIPQQGNTPQQGNLEKYTWYNICHRVGKIYWHHFFIWCSRLTSDNKEETGEVTDLICLNCGKKQVSIGLIYPYTTPWTPTVHIIIILTCPSVLAVSYGLEGFHNWYKIEWIHRLNLEKNLAIQNYVWNGDSYWNIGPT